jgi:hypothetical protein
MRRQVAVMNPYRHYTACPGAGAATRERRHNSLKRFIYSIQ